MRVDTTSFPFARYPAVRVCLCLIVGIVAELPVTVEWMLATLVVQALAEWGLHHTFTSPRYIFAIVHSIWMVVLAGSFVADAGRPEPFPSSPLDPFVGDTILVEGRIRTSNLTSSGRFAMVLDLPTGEALRLSADSLDLRRFRTGVTVAASIRLNPFPQRRNPNDFDYGAWLRNQGISHVGSLASVPRILSDTKRHLLADRIRANFSPANQELALAILLGQKNELDPAQRLSFSRSGLSHLMAVSGMHVGFLLAPLWFLIPYVWIRPRGREAAFALIVVVMIGYAALTGFTASVNRAGLMAILFAYARLFGRLSDGINILAGVAAILLLITPAYLLDVGFQLSFTAVASLMLLMPVTQRAMPYSWRERWYGKLIQFMSVSIVVQTALYPILAWYFKEFAWMGPIANLTGVPLTQFLFLWGFAAVPFSAIWPDWGWIFNVPADLAATVLALTATWMEDVPGAWTSVPKPSGWLFVVWLCVAALIASWSHKRRRWLWLIVLISLWPLNSSLFFLETLSTRSPLFFLDVLVYDVGQGDAVLIQTPSGKTVLYDTGMFSPGRNSGKDVILPDLEARRISHIDLIILSHPHADHTGGMQSLIDGIPIRRIVHADFPSKSAFELGWRMKAREKGIPVVAGRRGMEVSPDPAVKMIILHPDSIMHGSDPNPYSVVVKMLYGTTSFLFTGDADMETESILVARYDSLLRSDVLKAGHHGSKTSSGITFVEAVDPSHIAVSLGLRNRYKHPHAEAVRRMRHSDAEIRFTSRNRALHYTSDGTHITLIDW
jgi:competence protein ComEC